MQVIRRLVIVAAAIKFSSASLIVRPLLQSLLSLSDREQQITASFGLPMEYNATTFTADGLDDPRDAILVRNLVSGTSARVKLATMRDPHGTVSTGIQYVGAFKQSWHMSCYPFDTQSIKFEFVVPHPTDQIMDLVLRCGIGDSIEKDASGRVTACTSGEKGSSVGFYWGALECSLRKEGKALTCEMTGKRDSAHPVRLYILPSLIFTLVSIGTFFLPSSLAMPRLGATMFALLNLNVVRNAVMKSLPTATSTFMTEIVTLGLLVQFLNLVLHMFCIKFGDNHTLAHAFNSFSLTILPWLFCIILMTRMSMRECNQDEGVAIVSYTILVISAVCFAAACIMFFRRYIAPCCVKKGVTEKSDQAESLPAPPMTDSLQAILDDSIAGILPSKDAQLSSDFADALRAQWIVSIEQLMSADLMSGAAMSEATGLPAALCAKLIEQSAPSEKRGEAL
eukprot:TRINITY_DN7981_c0_g2_i1.p1 TRINITY_DN7981_c0_g2~~TRINITY_DN7981_c0_g2_i1.p1  ORF type:complete len:452 (-),score=46.67 TRINITY_DN7981_c0_g2_i1:39-1394(-)